MRAAAAVFLTLASALAAIPAAAAADEPPARVGRVSFTTGEVAIYLDPDHGWEKAYLNSPLTSENSLWTEPGARAEVRVGPITLRLDEATQLDIRKLDDDELRAHVVRGRLTVRVHQMERGDRFVVSTPQARFAITAPGRYRLDADDDRNESVLTVFNGSAQVEAGRRATVQEGDAVRVLEDGEHFEFERLASTPFDEWSVTRDQRVERAVQETVRYVSPQMTGYEDLAEYGRWSTEPDYGAVWYPRVAADYVPYRDGRWVHTRPWGWTWVDNAPWGYAPFHYGRWVYVGNRWGWCPGRYVARPVWAPALVGWVGGSSFNVSIGSSRAPALGWYPLSPWDHYRPWYTNNTRYINNVNVIVTRPPRGRDHERDHHRERGATVVLREDFVRQRPVAQGIARVSGEAMRDAVRAQPVASNPAQFLPPRTEVQRVPRGSAPAQVGGEVAGAPAAGRRGASKPVFTPGPTIPQATQAAPVAPRVVQPAPPATRPSVGGEAVRPERAPRPQAVPQAQVPQAAPQPAPQAPAATRPRPSQPVELREDRRPAPQPLPAAPAATRPQPAPLPQAAVPATRPQPAPQPQVQQVEPAPRAAPANPQRREEREERQEKPDKPEKPGRGRER